MNWPEFDVRAAHERYNDLLAEACKERLIRAVQAASERTSASTRPAATLIERIVVALHFRRVAQRCEV